MRGGVRVLALGYETKSPPKPVKADRGRLVFSHSPKERTLQMVAHSFRTGLEQALRASTTAIQYKGVNRSKAEDAWVALSQIDRHEVIGSRQIAQTMGVSPSLAAKLRRLFHDLDLIDERPGEWNNLSAYNDPNVPARIVIHTTDPDAFNQRLGEMIPFVLSQANPSYNDTLIAYGDGVPLPEFYLWGRRSRLSRLDENDEAVCDRKMDNRIEQNTPVHFHVTNLVSEIPPVIYATPPLLASSTYSVDTEAHARRASTNCCLSVAEVSAVLGKSRRQAYREIERLIEQGRMERVGRNQYQFVDDRP